jgi:hypothetical protein
MPSITLGPRLDSAVAHVLHRLWVGAIALALTLSLPGVVDAVRQGDRRSASSQTATFAAPAEQRSLFPTSLLSGKCIDVAGAPGVDAGLPLQLWDYEFSGGENGTPTDQQWAMNRGASVGTLPDASGREADERYWPTGDSWLSTGASANRVLCAFTWADPQFRAYTKWSLTADPSPCTWTLTPGRDVYAIMQMATGRYLDAHQNGSVDFRAVTRPQQFDDTQLWYVVPEGGAYRIQQASTGRYLDAHENDSVDYSVVTREWQPDDTQRWHIETIEGEQRKIRQLSSGRWLDAYQDDAVDFMAVTRPEGNSTQMWNVEYVGREYTIQQASTGRFLDAELDEALYSSWVVTRPGQGDNSQRWMLLAPGGGNGFRAQQMSSRSNLKTYGSNYSFLAYADLANPRPDQEWYIGPA